MLVVFLVGCLSGHYSINVVSQQEIKKIKIRTIIRWSHASKNNFRWGHRGEVQPMIPVQPYGIDAGAGDIPSQQLLLGLCIERSSSVAIQNAMSMKLSVIKIAVASLMRKL